MFIGRKLVSWLFLQTEGNEWDLLVSRICLNAPWFVKEFAQNVSFLNGLLRSAVKLLQIFGISVHLFLALRLEKLIIIPLCTTYLTNTC